MEDATPHAISKTNKSHQSALPNGLIGDLWFAAADAAWSGANQLSLLLSNQTSLMKEREKSWIGEWWAALFSFFLLIDCAINKEKRKRRQPRPAKQKQFFSLISFIWFMNQIEKKLKRRIVLLLAPSSPKEIKQFNQINFFHLFSWLMEEMIDFIVDFVGAASSPRKQNQNFQFFICFLGQQGRQLSLFLQLAH